MVLGCAFCRYLQCVTSVTYHTVLHQHTSTNFGWAPVWSISLLMAVHASGSNRVDAYRFSRENLWDVGVEPVLPTPSPDNDPKISREEALNFLSAAKSEIG